MGRVGPGFAVVPGSPGFRKQVVNDIPGLVGLGLHLNLTVCIAFNRIIVTPRFGMVYLYDLLACFGSGWAGLTVPSCLLPAAWPRWPCCNKLLHCTGLSILAAPGWPGFGVVPGRVGPGCCVSGAGPGWPGLLCFRGLWSYGFGGFRLQLARVLLGSIGPLSLCGPGFAHPTVVFSRVVYVRVALGF